MAKPKSVKLRMLIMLRTLFKYSDEKHPIGFQEMNEYLRPHALECNRKVLNDTIDTLNDFGIKVSYRAPQYAGKAWITESLFSDEDIGCLVFALTANPHISKKQAAKMLEKLKCFATVYQEPLLINNVECTEKDEENDSLWKIFSTTQKACSTNCKIRYTTNLLKYSEGKKHVTIEESVPISFTPRRLYRVENELYLLGFKRSNPFPEAINLKDIASVRLSSEPVHTKDEQQSMPISDVLANADLPKEQKNIVYQGPVTFRCRGRYLRSLFLRFGPPSDQIKRSKRSIVTYPTKDIALTSDDLHWLSRIPGFGIRIVRPEGAVEAVRTYYNRNAQCLTDSIFPKILAYL